MAIPTDSTHIDQPKNYDKCIIFNLYQSIASKEETETMETNYKTPGYGYSQAKKELFQIIMDKFATERQSYNIYIKDKAMLEKQLIIGETKATAIATDTLTQIRKLLGY